MSGECPRLGRLVRGCNFEPRYDELAPDLKLMAETLHGVKMSDACFKALRQKIYVKDVCTSCGSTMER